MGPTILLDKSALQSLSRREIIALSRLFTVNIAPVLGMEILADLKKGDDPEAAREQTVILANKLLQIDSAVNIQHGVLLLNDLLGTPVSMIKKPVVLAGDETRHDDGRTGMYYEETDFDRAILRWQTGDFDAADSILASQWRRSSEELDLEAYRTRNAKSRLPDPGPSSLGELTEMLDAYVEATPARTDVLTHLIREFGFSQEHAQRICYRAECMGPGPLSQMSAYGALCAKTGLIFYYGLVHGFIGTRATNRIDLDYLYYLPFTHVFVSGDKFHVAMAPCLVRDSQMFVDAAVLKAELKAIADVWGLPYSEGDKGASQYVPEPLDDPDSLLYKIWKMAFPQWRPGERDLAPTLTEEQKRQIVEQVNKMARAEKSGGGGDQQESPEFIVRSRTVSIDSPCHCGSGKSLRECCLRDSDEK
ncbi:SEC-C domain-containing protein [Candidatus Bipolaricaulota bacterium]|nr:SEC-C domain-containing protein [Candidatus Bipolaricaulota bacterium]